MPEPAPAAIVQLLDAPPARVGLAASRLDGSRSLAVRADKLFTQASAIKIPILWALERGVARGDLDPTETLAIDPADGAGGCGVLQSFLSGTSRLALRDVAVMMIVLSDNVATNLLIRRVGMDAVNALLEKLGAEQTRLCRVMMDAAAREAGRENTSTPAEAVALMQRLASDADAGDAAAEATLTTTRLRKESPVTAALFPKQGSDVATLATKPGMLDGLRTEWSLVETRDGVRYAMALMADGADDAVLEPLFRDLARAVHAEMTTG